MNRYITEFLKLSCAPQLLEWKMFPNNKEITESMGAFNALRTYRKELGVEFSDEDVLVLVPGDGHKPRTGALIAMRTAWKVVSIDPALTKQEFPVKRLMLERITAQQWAYDMYAEYEGEWARVVIVVGVHSHATMQEMLAIGKVANPSARLHIITIPCCVDHDIKNTPYIGYRDRGIISPKNEVKIWLDV